MTVCRVIRPGLLEISTSRAALAPEEEASGPAEVCGAAAWWPESSSETVLQRSPTQRSGMARPERRRTARLTRADSTPRCC